MPNELLPKDGRFSAGPTLVRKEQIDRLVAGNKPRSPHLIMGTSHRQAPVKNTVAEIRDMLGELFSLPDGYEVVLGNGGPTAFWAVAATSLIERRAAHATLGSFSTKFYNEVANTPFLEDPVRFDAKLGELKTVEHVDDVDAYAYPHHETSTGVISPVKRVEGGLGIVDATSIAGAIQVDMSEADAYYFGPQKVFGSDGGLWLAILSPAAIERAFKLHEDKNRWMPQFLDLSIAIHASRQHQTLNTPAIATLVMMHEQLKWLLDNGGLAATEKRVRKSSDLIYDWAEKRPFASPLVKNPEWRSPVVTTINFEGVDASELVQVLRDNGVLDVSAYYKENFNQLRIGTWPAIAYEDVEALLASIDYAVERLSD